MGLLASSTSASSTSPGHTSFCEGRSETARVMPPSTGKAADSPTATSRPPSRTKAPLDQYVGINWPRHSRWPHRRGPSTGTCLLPPALTLPDALQRTPTRVRAEPLPRRAPLAHEPLVAAGPVTTGVEKTL